MFLHNEKTNKNFIFNYTLSAKLMYQLLLCVLGVEFILAVHSEI
jgi:hypothetical protein